MNRGGANRQALGAGDGLMLTILLLPVLGTAFLSKFALPFMPVDGIGLNFLALYLALALAMLVPERVALEPARLRFFCFMAGLLGGLAAWRGELVSLSSLALLLMLHLPYVLHFDAETVRERARHVFLTVALFIAVLGLAQYSLQYVMPARYLFPIENLLPASWRVTGFNMQIPFAWGSSYYRANGVFLPEPSFYSQFLALALLVELLGPNRLWRAGVYALAILAARSGTGLMLLAAGLPVLMLARRRGDLLLLCLLLAPVLYVTAPYLHLDQVIGRIGEFGSSRSSAYERFVGGFHVFEAALGDSPLRLLFGYGAGTYREVVQNLGLPAAEMALFKMVVEFGVIGALVYFGFFFYCLLSARGPLPLRLALALCLFLNGAYNAFVHSLALSLLVWPSPRRKAASQVARADSAPVHDPSPYARMIS